MEYAWKLVIFGELEKNEKGVELVDNKDLLSMCWGWILILEISYQYKAWPVLKFSFESYFQSWNL